MTDPIISELSSLIETQGQNDSIINLPEDAPFDNEQRQWLNGLLTGINTIAAAAKAGSETVAGTPLSILYGSQSGNSEVLAKDLKKFAATVGFDGVIEELDNISLEDLAAKNHVLIVCSTFGEGEPPDNAKNFYEALMGDSATALPASLHFSVCGLGDTSYADFNQCARDIHKRMVELGATACHDLVECDVAFEDDFASWKEAVFKTEVFTSAAGSSSVVASNDEHEPVYTKNHPFVANLIESQCLSGKGSAKRVNHVAISLAGGGEDMHYDVGDALGVWPLNNPEAVEDLLKATGFSGAEIVQQKNGAASLRMLLLSKLDIDVVNAKALETWGIDEAPEDYEVYDVITQLKPKIDAQTFIDGLRPLQPRLYSIASSPKTHPGEVHLTVGEVRYDLHNKSREGVASTWLGERLALGSSLGVYIQASAHFHIPNNDDAPLIMIGPGTGIAPFRSFLEEREARDAAGDNWLFFGDQHEAEDFLYRDEIAHWQQSGVLNKASLAWSRDTDKKIYVQTLIKEQGAEFFEWLEKGAYIYICGDASRMAADVDKAIREVIGEYGKLDEQGADEYMNTLTAEHRYQRDVY